jgi:hypothetical protein
VSYNFTFQLNSLAPELTLITARALGSLEGFLVLVQRDPSITEIGLFPQVLVYRKNPSHSLKLTRVSR